MRLWKAWMPAALLLFGGIGAAKGQQFSPDDLMEARARVAKAEFAIASANATQNDLCMARQRWLSGFIFSRPSVSPTEPTVYRVWPGSPAERSGLRAGDRITHVRGQHLGYGQMGQDSYGRLASPTGSTVTVVSPGQPPKQLQLRKQPVCGPPVHMTPSGGWTAATDGKVVLLSVGTVASLTDDELAAVIGHEFAHVSLRHIEKKQNRAVLGAILGAAVGGVASAELGGSSYDVQRAAEDWGALGAMIGSVSYSKRMERRADCVGVYYAARAGYDVSAAPPFWERLAGTNRDHQKRGGTHPTPVERAFRTRLAADDVARQLERVEPSGIQIPECKEPKLKKKELQALYADHIRRREVERVTVQETFSGPAVADAEPEWQNLEVKSVSEVADDVGRQQSQPESSEHSRLVVEDVLERLRREWREQLGRWPTEQETESLREMATDLANKGGENR